MTFKPFRLKNLFLALMSTTMLGGIGCVKQPTAAEKSVDKWKADVNAYAFHSFDAEKMPPSLARETSRSVVDGADYFAIIPRDSTINLWEAGDLGLDVDADDLLTQARQAGKKYFYYDRRFESGLTFSGSSDKVPHYYAFDVADLQEWVDDLKKNAAALHLKPAKLFLHFNNEVNAFSHWGKDDPLVEACPSYSILTINTGALREDDLSTLKGISDHELGHFVMLPRMQNLAERMNLSEQTDPFSRDLFALKRYDEYCADSVAVTLCENGLDLTHFFTRTQAKRRTDINGLIENSHTKRDTSDAWLLRGKLQESVEAFSLQDEAYAIHPTDINRIRNMIKVRAYHETFNMFDRANLQSLMIKPPQITAKPPLLGWRLTAFYPK